MPNFFYKNLFLVHFTRDKVHSKDQLQIWYGISWYM